MDKNQKLLTEAILNAERAAALLKECRSRASRSTNSIGTVRSLAAAARDELTDCQAVTAKFLKSLSKKPDN